MYLVTTEQMRQLEEAAVEAGATWEGLMEQAGWGVAQHALHHLGTARQRRVVVLVGPGNNGGDGLVVARHLHDAHAQVTLYIWKRSSAENDTNWQCCRERDIPETLADDDPDQHLLRDLIARADMVVDALLGMGGNRPVTGSLAAIVETLNEITASIRAGSFSPTKPLVLAVDLPTGIQSDNGSILGVALRADHTVATGVLKRGMVLSPGQKYTGTRTVVDIGIPHKHLETIMSETMTREAMRALLPARPPESHKGTFGKALIVAGSLYYPGAAGLATAGAARAGTGLVTLAAARSIIGASGRSPEITVLPLPEADIGTLGMQAFRELSKHLNNYHALLVGPGLGQEEATALFLRRLLGLEPEPPQTVGFRVAQEQPRGKEGKSRKDKARDSRVGFRPVASSEQEEEHDTDEQPDPNSDTAEGSDEDSPFTLPPTVLDADGLNLLAEIEDWYEHLAPERCILTPHPGEMRRLLKTKELETDRVQVAADAAARWRQVVVLKGETTVVAAPDGRSAVYSDGNPALATAGTGDVLAGVITGLLAQGMASFDAARLGVYLHATAGELVRAELGDMGTLAGDLLPRLPRASKQLKEA
jgi:NAD(P)H-hydrate epimerase